MGLSIFMVLKMVKASLKVLTLVLLLAMLSSRAYALNLGSVARNRFAEVSNNDSARLTILFWNVDSELYTIRLSVKESPKDWIVIFDPDEFVLNRTTGDEYISLPYTNEMVMAKAVNVFVKPDVKSKSGEYGVVVKAETIFSSGEVNGMSVVPERLFAFTVRVNGLENSDSVIESPEPSGNVMELENDVPENGSVKNESSKYYFYSIAAMLIVITSIVIYKKM